MKIFITGGGGFLGSHLADAFLGRGDEVYALDCADTTKVSHNFGQPRFHYIQESILNERVVEKYVRECDLIYHLAAVVGVQNYVSDPLQVLDVNINGTQKLLMFAHRYNKKVVFSSTSEVYGKNPEVPFNEESDRVLGPTHIDRWCYSTSKATGEHFCFAYAKKGLLIVILRYFNVYGPRLDSLDAGRVVSVFAGKLLRGEPLTVIGDGQQTRCFTYVNDAIDATVRAGLSTKTHGEVLNIGTDTETTILELAEIMADFVTPRARILHVRKEELYGDSYEDIPRRVPDNQKIKRLLGWSPKTPLKEGITETFKWYQEQTLETARLEITSKA